MSRLLPATLTRQHLMNLRNPPLCEELRVRDILDNAAVMTCGSFVAAYELGGLHSQYHPDETRNRAKEAFEAVLRGMPERSMRLSSPSPGSGLGALAAPASTRKKPPLVR